MTLDLLRDIAGIIIGLILLVDTIPLLEILMKYLISNDFRKIIAFIMIYIAMFLGDLYA